MIRFRRKRAQDLVDGLCERDAARLRAFMAQAQPTPGMDALRQQRAEDSILAAWQNPATFVETDQPKRKRGRRA